MKNQFLEYLASESISIDAFISFCFSVTFYLEQFLMLVTICTDLLGKKIDALNNEHALYSIRYVYYRS